MQVNECDCQGDTLSSPMSCQLFALPVELLNFRVANRNNLKAQLQWETASEQNVSHFEVYRSTNGINFYKVGEEKAIGNSQTILSYRSLDHIAALPEGVLFYKLKMVDENGSFDWSPTRSISKGTSNQGKLSILPNPATDQVSVDVSEMIDGSYSLSILDATGKLVYQGSMKVQEGKSSQELNISNLATGIYTITINGQSQKLLIKK